MTPCTALRGSLLLLLGGASAASAYTSSAVIRAGESLATKVFASSDSGAAQVTLWPGSGLVQGYARSLAAGGDATGFTLTQQSGLHRSRAGELLPPSNRAGSSTRISPVRGIFG